MAGSGTPRICTASVKAEMLQHTPLLSRLLRSGEWLGQNQPAAAGRAEAPEPLLSPADLCFS